MGDVVHSAALARSTEAGDVAAALAAGEAATGVAASGSGGGLFTSPRSRPRSLSVTTLRLAGVVGTLQPPPALGNPSNVEARACRELGEGPGVGASDVSSSSPPSAFRRRRRFALRALLDGLDSAGESTGASVSSGPRGLRSAPAGRQRPFATEAGNVASSNGEAAGGPADNTGACTLVDSTGGCSGGGGGGNEEAPVAKSCGCKSCDCGC